MRRYFCDYCGIEITDVANRHIVTLYDRKEKKSKQILNMCGTDIKKVIQMKFVPMHNCRVRNYPKLYNVVTRHLGKTKSQYIIPDWNIDQLESLKRKDPTMLRTADGYVYYTKEYILKMVECIRTSIFDPKRKLMEYIQLLYNQQTDDEKKTYETKHHNNRGFNKSDAQFLSAMARISFDKGIDAISESQYEASLKRFKKYAEQVANILNENHRREVI